METIINIIKSEFTDKAIDLSESLLLLNETISSTIDDISIELNNALKSRDKLKMDKYNRLVIEGFKYEEIIGNIIKLLEIDSEPDMVGPRNVDRPIKKHLYIPNYSEYLVDNQIEHNLLDDFKHKRPFGFKFLTNDIIEASTWKDVFIKTCEIVYDIDSAKFNGFEELGHMRGKIKKYFSKNDKELRSPF